MCQSCTPSHLKGPLSLDEVSHAHTASVLFEEGRLDKGLAQTLDLESLAAPLNKGLKGDSLRRTRDEICKGLLGLTESWLLELRNEQSPAARPNQEYRFLSAIQRALRGRLNRAPNQIVILGPAIEAFCLKEDLRVLRASIVQLAFLAKHSPYSEASEKLGELLNHP